MGKTVTISVKGEQLARLEKMAQRLGKSQSELGKWLIEEGLREAEHPLIDFRDTPVGRQAYMRGSRLGVWRVVMTVQELDMDEERVSRYFDRPLEWVRAALDYYRAYRHEIDASIEESRSMTYEKLKAILPQLELLEVPREVLSGEQEP